MYSLARQIRAVPREKLPGFSTGLIHLDLMRASPILHALVWVIVKVRGWTPFQTWCLILGREVRYAAHLRDSFAAHVEAGHDLTDPRSAGGLSGDELVRTLNLLSVCGTDQPSQEP